MDNTVEVQELGKVMITNRGEYIPSKSYEILDIVSYNGSSFMSKIDDNTNVPAEEISPDELLINENWQLVAKKGDTYKVTEEDLQAIAKQITDNANSAFNQNVKTKTKEFNTNATNKLNDYDTNSKSTTETFDANAKKKLDEYNANDTKKLKAYNDNADNKLSAYNTNDANKLKAYNTNADSKIEEYNTNANSKILEYDKHSEELRNMAISTDNELERVKNEVLDTGSASDSFIHVEDSCMAKLKELEIEGVLQQKTTKGNQLIDFTSIGSISCDVKFENDTLKITSNKSYSRASKNITELLQNNVGKVLNFTFESINFSKTLGGRIQLNILKNDRTRLYQGLVETSGKKVNYTIPNDFSDITSITLEIYSNNTSENSDTELTILKPLLYFENNDSYEPYTGGQPSPSPEFPQEIKTITDSLKVTSCGKNLFSVNIPTTTRGGITVSQDEDGIHVQGTSTNIVNFLFPTKILNRLAGKTITLTCADLTNSNIQNISFKSPATNTVYCAIDQNVTSRTYTLPVKIADDTVFSIYILNSMTIDVTLKIQVEIGNKSEYEPYVESLIEAKLPEGEFIGKLDDTYKDTLRTQYFPEEGKYHWMLDKMVGMGDTSKYFGKTSRIATNQNNYRFTFDIKIDKIPKSNTEPGVTYPLYCNKFIKGSRATSYAEINSISYGTTTTPYSQIVLYYSEIKGFTIAQFSDWLTNNPLIIFFALQTPYTIDLGPIDMPLSYKEITNVFTDSDLLPTINAKYYRTFEKTIQNLQINDKTLKQEITDLNNSISDISKRLEALESANVNTVEESEASNDLQN